MSMSTWNLSPEPPEVEPEPAAYAPGTCLNGTYRIVGQLASGGMGDIYTATHARLPGLFVIKILQASFSNDVEILARFRREAEVMATLRHPHVAQVVDYNVTPDDRPYLVMEHIDGADLAEVARQHGPMSPQLVADFVKQTAAALAAAHAKGIVHLDLKPENVMVLVNEDRTAFIKVIDFGIAKTCHQPNNGVRTIIGTPDYMSPEQVDGAMEFVDGRSDQFSLAVMAFVLLTGHSPWGAEEPVTTLYRICREPPQALANYLAVPLPELENVLHIAMAKDPAERFASVSAFARAFEEAVAWDVAAMPSGLHRIFAAAPLVAHQPETTSQPVFDAPLVAATDDAPTEEPDESELGDRASRRARSHRRTRAGATMVALAVGLVAWLASGPRMRAASLLSEMLRWVPAVTQGRLPLEPSPSSHEELSATEELPGPPTAASVVATPLSSQGP